MTDAQFEEANRLRTSEGKPAFANPRNAVAGCIRRQHSSWEAPMTFAAYGIVTDGTSHTSDMARLVDLGFQTALGLASALGAGRVETIEQAREVCQTIAGRRAEMVCGIDGAVVKADDQSVRAQAGATGKSPRWAIARKFPPDTRQTTLLDIECNLGRTGALTVRAVLEPVAVGGVVIRYCTLSNPTEIARKDLRIGDTVWVRRAGEVIPEITGVELSKRTDDRQPWEAPENCPRCGSELDRTQKVWRCPNGRMCGLVEALEYAVSRDALDVEGLGEKLVRQLVEAQLVTDVADLFSLTVEQLAALDRMGTTSAKNVIDQLDKAKQLPLSRVLTALGVRLTGRRMCRRIAKAFPTMDALRSATLEELASIDGVGEIKAEVIANELAELGPVINRLASAGVNMTEPTDDGAAEDAPLSGKKVCVTGSIPGHTRDSAQLRVEQLGGTAVSSVTSKTDLLVVGDGGGSKAKKAEQLGVKTITAEEFIALTSK